MSDTPVVDATPPLSPDGGSSSGFSTHQGVGIVEEKNGRFRRTMEDTHAVRNGLGGDPDTSIFCIFDGHGGRQAAEYCRDHMIDTIAEELAKGPEGGVCAAVTQAFVAVDEKMATASIKYAGCTVALAVIRRLQDGARKIYACNAGDARTVLCRNGAGVRLSYDHKGTDEEEGQRIIALGGFMNGGRVNGLLAVTRSLGDLLMKQYVVSTPYTTEVVVEDGDKWLIIACDGIWDVIDDDAAAALIQDLTDAQAAAQLLLRTALDNGTTDNVTVVVIKL